MKRMKKYFIPHKENDYKPHVMRKTSLAVISLLSVFVFFVAVLQTTILQKSNFLSAVIPQSLAVLANSDRGANNLQSLSYSPVLEAAAQEKANDMAAKGYFAHNSPEGITPWYWFSKVGYSYVYAGENLAVNFSDSADVNNAWMNSPGHRANILNDKFSEVGIATALGYYKGAATVFVVQMFGRPSISINPPVQVAAAPTPITSITESNETITSENVLSESQTENQTFIAVENPDVKEVEFSPESEEVSASWIQKALSSPNRMLNLSYLIIGAFVLISLLLMVFIEIKHQHPRNVLAAVGVLVLIVALAYIYRSFLLSEVIVL